MKSMRTKLSAIASGVALGVASMAVTAADQPQLAATGPKAGAVFTGGATINGGASFLSTVPAADAVDLVATISPAAGDVGQSGSLVAVLDVPGVGLFNLLSGGIWVPFDGSTILPFATKTLSSSESVEVLDGLIGADTNLTGLTLTAYVGYYTGGDVSNITYTSAGAKVTISPAPAAGCPAGTAANTAVPTFEGKPVCNIPTGTVTEDMHLTANNTYFFNGSVFFGDNTVNTPDADKVVLTIDAGTKILSEGSQSALVITRAGKIFANGTAAKPIVMTTSQDDGSLDAANARGLWGGLVLSGSAQLNSASGFSDGEGSTGEYGGGTNFNNADSSGALTYLQLKYAGFPITQDDELNTLSLQGVGSGTIIDYVQAHNGADDGVEFYGGAVNAKHLLLTGNDDDSIDWTLGWSGKVQHVIVEKTTGGDNCIEADNLSSGPTNTPRSQPTVSNLTCITSTGQSAAGHAFELKAGTGGNLSNVVVGGNLESTEGCVFIANEATFTQSGASIAALNGTLTLENTRVTDACGANLGGEGPAWTTAEWFAAQAGTSAGTVDLGGPYGWANGTAINAVPHSIPSDSFFDQVDYIGAVKDESSDWTESWSFTGYQQ
ncbi:MAG: hypothetical protein ACE37N_03925 [Pseudohongiellaceae bacterium]